ncbi:restriction endonuclease [Clostridium botulinum]|nr:restriction endonuclease [Clostridium botulinum]MBN1078312.1 restriction endonuclease [Clostridium botulinum]NFO28720.1 restriction endonuclease [Clostridium botulinum]NFO53871.1 restriction endonuclease [Clostridium botulinum]
MTGSEFEIFTGELFKKMEYKTMVTKATGDQGIDVIAEKNGVRYGIQAKCYSNTVSNSAIQEVVAGIAFYKCDKAIVITNNYFTNAAIGLAKANGVVLWDRTMLKQKICDLF